VVQALIKEVEGKKVQEKSTKKEVEQTTKGVWTYLEEIKDEFRKISWTSREELRAYTKIVLGATLFFGMAIFFADVAIQQILAGIDAIILKVTG
jgi:preprotein translocase subunit SecE